MKQADSRLPDRVSGLRKDQELMCLEDETDSRMSWNGLHSQQPVGDTFTPLSPCQRSLWSSNRGVDNPQPAVKTCKQDEACCWTPGSRPHTEAGVCCHTDRLEDARSCCLRQSSEWKRQTFGFFLKE